MATEPTITDAFSALTMSSREIADLTGKRHDHVVRDIEKMLSEIGEGLPNFGDTYRNEQNGQEYRCFNLPKNLTIVLVAGYRADIRLKIVDRWMALEAAASAPIASHDFYVPQTKAEALRLAADLTEQVEEQRQRLDVAEPKAEALDKMSALNAEPKGVRDVGRHLEIGQSKVADLVVQWGWACRESGKLKPTHYGREKGYTVLTSRVFTNKTTHEEHVVLDFKMTRKGINRMAVRLAKEARTKPRLEPGMAAKINNAP
ncbi:Rha family transcriptional regulator [Asaia sp. HumB]|uniref:Rha family transcriptional regulator n=1 Tax=Asaia sp. HumB TaxID=3035475 RepID=UPI0025544CD8|nr:Rha family transcriptional regulator [Asaia sp. HumB]MDL2169588.1 Rha family transcriptional regulator [Asaia sp. HumB]